MPASANELRYFIELSKTLNFSRASERIGISQPSLSAAIKRLEQSIGTSLFNRNKNGVNLTQAGKRLLSHTKELLQMWETVKSKSLASHHEIQGSVSIGCHPLIALCSLPGVLPHLLKQYPKLEVRLKHDLSRKIVEGVINLSIDIGIVVNPIKHPDLILQKLYDDRTMFWQAADGPKLAVENSIIICDPELIQTQYLLKKLSRKGFKHQRMLTSSSLDVIAALTANGGGIGILPASVVQATQQTKIKPILNLPFYNDESYLVYRNENRGIQAIQTINQALKQFFKKEASRHLKQLGL